MRTTTRLTPEQSIQEEQYQLPYHYIPQWRNDTFSQTQTWSWGYRYLGGLQVALDQLEAELPHSLVDIGCGDGRFLREVHARCPHIAVTGIDYSQRAVGLARALNPNIEYLCGNILSETIDRRFEAASLIEVLEHIEPASVTNFLGAVRSLLVDDGRLILTVPHSNKKTAPKHFQHFSKETLLRTLEPHFAEIAITPFDDIRAPTLKVMDRIFSFPHLQLTSPPLLTRFFQRYLRRHLYLTDETRCGRLLAVCRRG